MACNPPKSRFTFTVKEFYNEYEGSVENPVPYRKYKKIIKDFFTEVSKKIIYENLIFNMPYQLGMIVLKARKTNIKKARVDFHLTKKTGKVVKHLNTHSFGYYFQIAWDKSFIKFRNHSFYAFRATASKSATDVGAGRRALSKHIKDTSKDPDAKSLIKI